MAELEERVALLEREMAALKERTGRHDEDLTNIPELIKVEFRMANSRTARLAQDVAEMRADLSQFRGEVEHKLGKLDSKVDTFFLEMPKLVADTMREVLAERDRRR